MPAFEFLKTPVWPACSVWMPEGPSIVILKEAVPDFEGQEVLHAEGNSKVIDFQLLEGKRIKEFRSWGKHFLICFPGFFLRIHFMLFGSYRINERKESRPRLSLRFKNGELNFYACSVKFVEEDPDDIYDWSADVMNPAWDSKQAMKKLKASPDMMACDALLDQDIFAGVGNIIKNEVLYRIGVHPESIIGKLPPAKLRALIKEAVNYSFQFYEWKKNYVLKKHWLVHTKKECPIGHGPLVKAHLGKTNRRSFFCGKCQKRYL